MKAPNTTSFINITNSQTMPIIIKLKLDPCIKTQLLKEIDQKSYTKIQIKGFDLQNSGEIDLSENEDLLFNIVNRVRMFSLPPGADFILQWEASKGIKMSNGKQSRFILAIISFLCRIESTYLDEYYHDCELSKKFTDMMDIYINFSIKNIPKMTNENKNDKKSTKRYFFEITLSISFIIYLLCKIM